MGDSRVAGVLQNGLYVGRSGWKRNSSYFLMNPTAGVEIEEAIRNVRYLG